MIHEIRFGRARLVGWNDRDPGIVKFSVAMTDDVYAFGNSDNDDNEYSLVYDSMTEVVIDGPETKCVTFEPTPMQAKFVKLEVSSNGACIDELEVFGVPCSEAAFSAVMLGPVDSPLSFTGTCANGDTTPGTCRAGNEHCNVLIVR